MDSVAENAISEIEINPNLQEILRGPQGEAGRAGRSPIILKGKPKPSKLGVATTAEKGGFVYVTVSFPKGNKQIDALLTCELHINKQFDRVLSAQSMYRQDGANHALVGSLTAVVPTPTNGDVVEWKLMLTPDQGVDPKVSVHWSGIH